MTINLRKSDAKEPFSFIFVNAEGKTIVKSENYAQKPSAKNGIESVRKNCQDDANKVKMQIMEAAETAGLILHDDREDEKGLAYTFMGYDPYVLSHLPFGFWQFVANF